MTYSYIWSSRGKFTCAFFNSSELQEKEKKKENQRAENNASLHHH